MVSKIKFFLFLFINFITISNLVLEASEKDLKDKLDLQKDVKTINEKTFNTMKLIDGEQEYFDISRIAINSKSFSSLIQDCENIGRPFILARVILIEGEHTKIEYFPAHYLHSLLKLSYPLEESSILPNELNGKKINSIDYFIIKNIYEDTFLFLCSSNNLFLKKNYNDLKKFFNDNLNASKMHLQIGKEKMEQLNYQEAVNYFAICLKDTDQTESIHNEAKALSLQANIRLKIDLAMKNFFGKLTGKPNYSYAKKLFLEILDQNLNTEINVNALFYLTQIEIINLNFDQASTYLLIAKELNERLEFNDKFEAFEILINFYKLYDNVMKENIKLPEDEKKFIELRNQINISFSRFENSTDQFVQNLFQFHKADWYILHQDYNNAFLLFDKIAKRDIDLHHKTWAQFYLADMRIRSIIDESQFPLEQAVLYLEEFANKSNYLLIQIVAKDSLSKNYYIKSKGTDIKFYEDLAKQNLNLVLKRNALKILSKHYYDLKDEKQAAEYFEQFKQMCDSQFHKFDLAEMYYLGKDIQQDLKLAYQYYIDVASCNEHKETKIKALTRLGEIFFKGKLEGKPDYRKSTEFYEKVLLEDANNINANIILGTIYYKGLLGTINKERAKEYFSKIVSKNNNKNIQVIYTFAACKALGEIFYSEANYESAKQYYEILLQQDLTKFQSLKEFAEKRLKEIYGHLSAFSN